LFGSSTKVEIQLAGLENRNYYDVPNEKGGITKLPIYIGDEPVRGKVLIKPKPGKKLEHQGIKIEFIGQIGSQNAFP